MFQKMDIKYGSITENNKDKDVEDEKEKMDNEDNIQETNNVKWVNCKLTLLGKMLLAEEVSYLVNMFL